jgi:hypothetical protein
MVLARCLRVLAVRVDVAARFFRMTAAIATGKYVPLIVVLGLTER